ncbi:phage tail sheath family protein [[Clostridium] symbiosum]|uniref:phage tail sheath subtilisin-like domain-containing protein n=1 Tax=Clostridium symbiosum TaxID=1512 RepID=UPI001D07C851|nr:phage tail sheath subtilisin-like domain-containing protein [[Clostridium] symbiosum]MCB6608863.1 phage tail sheath subtilisin-like domain-containing protein [[Clostridium] symbiosum]MCB6930210.1 phage tail sheath subtilisin-like domain-containing protein [[Clostridium] symbiosum]
MAEYLSPGVYVEEFDSDARLTEGVGTSTAGFIGVAERGPVEGSPRMITNFAEFIRNYGGYLPASVFGNYRFLAYAVEYFFRNGGSRCFVMRVAPQDAVCAEGAAPAGEPPVLSLKAKEPGLWGNGIRVSIVPSSKAKTQILEVIETASGKCYTVKNGSGFMKGDVVAFCDGTETVINRVVKSRDNILIFEKEFEEDVVDKSLLPGKTISTCEFSMEVRYKDQVENYDNLSFNREAPGFVETAKSNLVSVMYMGETEEKIKTPFERLLKGQEAAVSISLSGGSNGNVLEMKADDFIGEDKGVGKRTGIQAFLDNDTVSIMAVPGITDPKVQLSLVAHCENLASRFAVLDIPQDARKVQDIKNHRGIFDSSYAALYHPWLTVYDSLDKKNIQIPPSGSVAGIYARSDNERGVHKAPANELVSGCVGLDIQFTKGEQDILNPEGVNLIRSFPGQGICVWGARTAGSDTAWKYINVRRLFIFIEESIKASTNWAVFEPNDEILWNRVQRTIEAFLTSLWRDGALAGTTTDEAFCVNIGKSTMTQDDIDNGRLICVIGVAPVKPAEFIIFRITQKTGDSRQQEEAMER